MKNPVVVKYNRKALDQGDPYIFRVARTLDQQFTYQQPEHKEWVDPVTGKNVMVVDGEFFEQNRSLFEVLPDVEIGDKV